MKKNIKVLLVDEGNAEENSFAKTLAELELNEVTTKSDLAEALDEYKAHQYDITFINNDMSDEEKIDELLNKIMEIDPKHYLVMLTDVATPEIVKNAIQHGASGFLNKPFTSKKIIQELEKFHLLREDKQISYGSRK